MYRCPVGASRRPYTGATVEIANPARDISVARSSNGARILGDYFGENRGKEVSE